MNRINLYDQKSLERLSTAGAEALRAFADTAYSGIVLERDLTQVDPRVLERRYPELAFMNSGIEANNTGGFADAIQTLRLQEQGSFTVAKGSTTAKGKISIAGEDGLIKVTEKAAYSEWTKTDLEQALLGRINLMDRLLGAANKVYQREIDYAGLLGVDANEGLLNHSLFAAEASTYDSTTATGVQMYDEVSELITDQWNAVNNIPEFMADRVIFPISVMNRLNAKMVKEEAGSKSVLAALRENFPSVTFLATQRAESVGGQRVMVAFSTNSEGLIFRLPVPLTIGEIVKTGSFESKVDYMYRLAGLDVLEPLAARIMTGF